MVTIRHASWKSWPHVGECYRVRNRGGSSAYSREGFVWTDSYGNVMDRPANIIQFIGGPKDGAVEAK